MVRDNYTNCNVTQYSGGVRKRRRGPYRPNINKLKNPPPSEAESKDKHSGGGSPTTADLGTEKLSAQIGKLAIDKDLDKPLDTRLDMLHEFFVRSKQDGLIQEWKKMVNEAERLQLKNKAPLLLADVLFDEDVVNQIKTHRQLLRHFCEEDPVAQRHLLGGIERLVSKKKDQLMGKSAHIINLLYDRDICDEDTLLSWGEKPSSKYVKVELAEEMIKVAQPVLTWLRERKKKEPDVEMSSLDRC